LSTEYTIFCLVRANLYVLTGPWRVLIPMCFVSLFRETGCGNYCL